MEREFQGVWIPKEIWLNKDLDVIEKVLFTEINSLDTKSHCTAGNEYFAEFLGVSERTIARGIAHLKELGLIKSEFDGRTRTLRSVNLSYLLCQFDTQLNNSISSNINISNTNNINNKQEEFILEEESKKEEKGAQIKQFVEDYNSICKSLPKCIRMTAKRSKGIANLLKRYSYEDILTVFNNLENSAFCTGKNDRGWKADIDFILREDKFVAALEGKYTNSGRRCNVEAITPGEKFRVSAEEKEEMRKAVERGELKEY